MSGIVVFDLSRMARRGDGLVLDLLPEISLDELVELLENRQTIRRPRLNTPAGRLAFLDGALHPKLARHLMERCTGPDGRRPFTCQELASLIKSWKFEVLGPADESHAQVIQGGLDVSVVEPLSMSVRACPGLYVCGEALDIDGECGGLNLAWAWSSGMVAGVSAARRTGC